MIQARRQRLDMDEGARATLRGWATLRHASSCWASSEGTPCLPNTEGGSSSGADASGNLSGVPCDTWDAQVVVHLLHEASPKFGIAGKRASTPRRPLAPPAIDASRLGASDLVASLNLCQRGIACRTSRTRLLQDDAGPALVATIAILGALGPGVPHTELAIPSLPNTTAIFWCWRSRSWVAIHGFPELADARCPVGARRILGNLSLPLRYTVA